MRTIKKRPQPALFTRWRITRLTGDRLGGMACTYEELRRDGSVLEAVEKALLAEQGGICAYTGLRISIAPAGLNSGHGRGVDFHIEHPVPQKYCEYGQDADYQNMLACWPHPGCSYEPEYGARKKGSWPAPEEQPLFVSPLREDCGLRFVFDHRGRILPANAGDTPAIHTIQKLGLDHKTLTALRREAIHGALNPGSRPIRLNEARRLLARMEGDATELNRGQNARLFAFHFAIVPSVRREIQKLGGILRSS